MWNLEVTSDFFYNEDYGVTLSQFYNGRVVNLDIELGVTLDYFIMTEVDNLLEYIIDPMAR